MQLNHKTTKCKDFGIYFSTKRVIVSLGHFRSPNNQEKVKIIPKVNSNIDFDFFFLI